MRKNSHKNIFFHSALLVFRCRLAACVCTKIDTRTHFLSISFICLFLFRERTHALMLDDIFMYNAIRPDVNYELRRQKCMLYAAVLATMIRFWHLNYMQKSLTSKHSHPVTVKYMRIQIHM